MSNQFSSGFDALKQQSGLYPQESLEKVKEGAKKLQIGIPKETSWEEGRVSLIPQAVKLLVNNGHEVWVEAGAGVHANFSDLSYADAGARVIENTEEIFASDVLIKVEPPTTSELKLMKEGKVLFSLFQACNQSPEYLEILKKKRITALGFELLEDKGGLKPVVRAMGEIAGSSVMLIASEYLNSDQDGKGVLLGGVTGVRPTKVVILGAGTVGEYATRVALGLGAQVQVYDTHLYRLQRLKHTIGQQLYTGTVDTQALAQSLITADVVIGALRAEKGKTKMVISEEMVSLMPSNSIIIDVAIDQGGCCETSRVTSHSNPIYRVHDIIHYCVPNIASRVANTASNSLSNIFTPILLKIAEEGGIDEMIYESKWFMKGIYAYKGYLTNAHIARQFNMKFRDLNLLIAARGTSLG